MWNVVNIRQRIACYINLGLTCAEATSSMRRILIKVIWHLLDQIQRIRVIVHTLDEGMY